MGLFERKELGNYYKNESGDIFEWSLIVISGDNISNLKPDGKEVIATPILITDEVLVQMGFEYTFHEEVDSALMIRLSTEQNLLWTRDRFYINDSLLPFDLVFIHQLQNFLRSYCNQVIKMKIQ
ncbi:hypothetical protein MRBLMN1_001018 [Chitinophaga ginsengisegetis]|uniref:hypothetical protein n=1 Tax=Chitinophaga ginsengisegetis TaxID=393003 RepID=UPI00341AD494